MSQRLQYMYCIDWGCNTILMDNNFTLIVKAIVWAGVTVSIKSFVDMSTHRIKYL